MASAEDTVRSYFKHFESGEAREVAELFAEDAILMPNGVDTVKGREAIRTTFEAIFRAVTVRFEVLTFDRIREFGDTAVAETQTTETITSRSEKTTETGHFRELFVLCRSGDVWQVVSYMGNEPCG